MRRLFADTSAWLAIADRDDQYHARAAALRSVLAEGVPLTTSDYVLDEAVTRIRYDLGHREAEAFLDHAAQAEKAGNLSVLWVDAALWDAATRIFRRYNDQAFSMTDCTSFALAAQHGITDAFTFDRHFSLFGLTLVPGM